MSSLLPTPLRTSKFCVGEGVGEGGGAAFSSLYSTNLCSANIWSAKHRAGEKNTTRHCTNTLNSSTTRLLTTSMINNLSKFVAINYACNQLQENWLREEEQRCAGVHI